MNKGYKIVAINGSHRSEKGISEILLDRFLKGAKQEGAECEIIYPSKMNISSCKVCHKCIVQTPGQCFQKDDMQGILEKIENSDLLVFAAPVYFDTMSSDMKRMFERFMPTLGTTFEFRNGRTYHLTTSNKKIKAVSILVSGNPERESLQSISGTFCRIINNMGGEMLGEFFFPSSSLVVTSPELLQTQLQALTDAGKEVTSMKIISKETLAEANREYIDDPEEDINQKNKMFQELRKQYA